MKGELYEPELPGVKEVVEPVDILYYIGGTEASRLKIAPSSDSTSAQC